MKRLATIDIGTNSVRSIVVEVDDVGGYRIVDDEKAYTRLGQGRDEANHLAVEPMQRTVEALTRMLEIARKLGADEIRAIATAAMRDAPNAHELVERVREETGLAIEIISAEHEARLAFLSARANIPLVGSSAVIDLGGGSLEIVRAAAGEVEDIVSLPLGVVVLAEEFCRADPVPPKDLKRLSAYVRASLLEGLDADFGPVGTLVGSGGTVNALVAMTAARSGRSYPSLQGFEITLADVIHLLARLKRSSAKERAAIPGLPEPRVDIIIPGAVVVAEVMQALGANRLIANSRGIREGLVLEMLGSVESSVPLVRADSAVEFAKRFDYDAEHAAQVGRLASSLFDQLGSGLGLAEEHRDLLEAAAIMHDVGYYLSYERHHKQSHNLIAHSRLRGFTARELHMVAAVARYHRGGLPKPEHEELAGLGKRDRSVTISLAALLRAADGMDRARSGQVEGVRVERADGGVQLVLSGCSGDDKDLAVDVYGAQEKSDLLAKVLGADVLIRVET